MPAGAESAAPAVFHLFHLPDWESAAAAGAARAGRAARNVCAPLGCVGNGYLRAALVAWKDLLEMFARKTSLVREVGIHVAGCVKGAFGVQEVVSVMSLN